MSEERRDALTALADFMVEDILAATDEEILAEMTSADWDGVKAAKAMILRILEDREPGA